MLMLRSTHTRILAEGQERARETIAKAISDRDGARQSRLDWMRIAAQRDRQIEALNRDVAALRAEISRLTPKRDARGHFVKQESN